MPKCDPDSKPGHHDNYIVCCLFFVFLIGEWAVQPSCVFILFTETDVNKAERETAARRHRRVDWWDAIKLTASQR